MNLISLGVPNSLNSIESSTGIKPSIVPFINNSLQLFMFTIPVFTNDHVSWALSMKSSCEEQPNFSVKAGRAFQGYSLFWALSSHSREKKWWVPAP